VNGSCRLWIFLLLLGLGAFGAPARMGWLQQRQQAVPAVAVVHAATAYITRA
jgi:hypothetical protein